MGRKISSFFVILIFLSIISYGLINVNSNLTKFIKDESKIKVSSVNEPFEISIDMGDYIIYTGSDVILNIEEGTVKGINKLKGKVGITAYNFKENTSKGIERLLNLSEYYKSK